MEWDQYSTTAAPKPEVSPTVGRFVVRLQYVTAFLTRHWLFFLNGFFAVLILGALLAPLLMQMGFTRVGRVTYLVYSFTCHQLPERSYFFFTPNGIITTYNQQEVIADGADTTNLLTFREYIGSPEMGWKAGFSDRMFSMYGGSFIGGLIYWLFSRKRLMEPIPLWLMILLALPMAIDGTSHLISEVTGWGFRETNAWAMPIFGNQAADFYTGTTTGTLNSNLRLITGLLFGIGTMLFAYPLMGYGFEDLADDAARAVARNKAKLAELEESANL